MIVCRWHEQLAAIWHWYLPLIMHGLFNLCPSLFHFFFKSVNPTELLTLPTCPSLVVVCFFILFYFTKYNIGGAVVSASAWDQEGGLTYKAIVK